MPFRPGTREYWLEVGKKLCQWRTYEEEKGFTQCTKRASHVHHIVPEAEILELGGDPNATVGLPLCQDHHVRNFGDTPFEYDSGMHPDVAQAYVEYPEWKQKAKHIAQINNRSIDYSTSPFANIGPRHREMVRTGKRVCTGDDFTDRYYTELMQDEAVAYNTLRGATKKIYKNHPDYEPDKRKRWYDSILDAFK